MLENIVFDCDPGSDDSIAILEIFAHPEQFNVLGLTTVGGNQVLSNVTRNLQHMLWFLKQTTPIASGQATPIIKNLKNASEFHGENGLAGPTFPTEADNYPITSDNGITFLHQIIAQNEQPTTIVATAPLTNIALLLKVFPQDRAKIKQIVIMGGSLSGGNVTAEAEFNFYVDPDAADIVLHSQIPIVLCGLDVTNQTGLTDDEIATLNNQGPASQLAYEILIPYAKAEQEQHGFTIAPIHDLTTVTYLLDPTIFTGQKFALRVDNSWDDLRGKVQIDHDPAAIKNVLVLQNVQRKSAAQLLQAALQKLDQDLR
ncbi:nucleoside hydrolase [Bombilactobacillus folatiphilus]|uniref:Nucleoside hydrolase n=1 Tax=Bombilactobacillus folatiphilus TaxID=2923362 RepID=A0ABY4P9M5_9LACO|nr:nucleoside hydrolase [Bombilactobacillus folatiphilus]UQS82092.1 nucleoside hydrolase [Bombilactobacillus folatiphilus]